MPRIGRSPASRAKSRKFLSAVYHLEGKANTSEIRERSGLSRSEVKYRYTLLEAEGLIDVDYATGSVGEHESPAKIAVLTDVAYEEIERGLLQGEQYREEAAEPTLATIDSQLDTLLAQVEEQQEAIDRLEQYVGHSVYPNIMMLRWSVARLELSIEQTEVDLPTSVDDSQLDKLSARLPRFRIGD